MIEMTKEILAEAATLRQVKRVREIFDTYNIVDLADIVGELEISEALFIFKVLRKEVSGQVFTYLSKDKQESLVELLTNDQIKNILAELYSDDMMEFMDELPNELVKKILGAVSKAQREEINQLLSYAEFSCGSIMTTDFVELKRDDTIDEAMHDIKRQKRVAESISYGYVLEKDKLVGIVSMRDIIFAPEDSLLEEIMDEEFVAVTTKDDQELAIELIKKYDLTMIPVVDDQEHLVGVITSDDVIDVMEEEATEDIHMMAAVTPLDDSYMEASILDIAKSRLPWLLVLMISAVLSETVLARNTTLIVLIPALTYFTPMLMGSAGNAGSQAAAMVIRGITVEGLDIRSFFKVFWKELQVGIICGVVMFIVNYLRVIFTMPTVSSGVALVSSASVFVAIVVAKLVGGLTPLVAKLFHLDPAVLASPLIATVCDALSLSVYFALAWFLV
ncbi:MAG: magnesium transporter [Erysipelotrichaceae bacterium]|nr:magnesium transporter [Erysipelotrichaceae bacterium]